MESGSSSTPIGPLLATIFSSILEVSFLCLAGYILAGRGILDKSTQQNINRINVSLFIPALLFSKVAFFLSPAKLRELWIVPVFFILVTTVSISVSFSLSWLFGLKRSQRSFAMAATMFMSNNSFPVAIMQSLVLSVPGLEWGEDDHKSAMLGRSLTYLAIYSTFAMMLRWSYGVKLFSQIDEPGIQLLPEVNEYSPLISFPDHQRFASSSTIAGSLPTPSRRHSIHMGSFSSSNQSVHPQGSPSRFPFPDHGFDEDLEPLMLAYNPRRRLSTSHHSGGSHNFIHRPRDQFIRGWSTFNSFMSPPLWATFASLFVACIQPVQYFLEKYTHSLNKAISSAGDCSIPLTLVVLGAYFCPTSQDLKGQAMPPASKSTDTLVSAEGLSTRRHLENPSSPQTPGETKTVVITILSRMIITPLLLMPLITLSAKCHWLRVFEDPVFIVTNVLLVSCPTALTLAQLIPAASGDTFDRLISRTFFWSYCVVTPPATVFYVMVGIMLTKL